jgi:hypothetical protein
MYVLLKSGRARKDGKKKSRVNSLESKGYSGEWDIGNMGKMIIQSENLTVTHGGDFLGSYQCVRGTVPITSGVCYWEVNIDKLRYPFSLYHLLSFLTKC